MDEIRFGAGEPVALVLQEGVARLVLQRPAVRDVRGTVVAALRP
jgi:hypothetical protein